jgi:hypothetical protein
MGSRVSRRRPEGFLGLLRATAVMAVLAGAAGSIASMLRVGHRNNSRILLVLFTIWVLSPFAALIIANLVSKRWSVLTRSTLYCLMLALALGSFAIYGNVAFGPPRAQPAAAFLVVPLASWLLIATVIPIAALISGKRLRRGPTRGPADVIRSARRQTD